MNIKHPEINIEQIVREEKQKLSEKFRFLNEIFYICLKKGLSSAQHIDVEEKVIGNIIKYCESRLKISHSIKERYEQEIAKSSAHITRG